CGKTGEAEVVPRAATLVGAAPPDVAGECGGYVRRRRPCSVVSRIPASARRESGGGWSLASRSARESVPVCPRPLAWPGTLVPAPSPQRSAGDRRLVRR